MRVYLVVIFLITLTSCRKEAAPEENELNVRTPTPINDSLKSNYLFQPGTWWVYRSISDNTRDSIYVYSTTFSIYTITAPPLLPGQGPTYYDFEQYEMVLGGNTHETTRYYLLSDQFRTKFNEWEQINIFGIDEDTDSTVSDYNRIAFYDSIQIQNVWYYDVAKTKIYTYYHSCCPIPDLDYYYISREYGIIKKEIANPADSTYKIYELVNKNIVR